MSTPADFDFRSAVCSHGFFVLAPNVWDPARSTLRTVITLDDLTAIAVQIAQTKGRKLVVRSVSRLSSEQNRLVRSAVRRMLRLDESLAEFHALCRRSTSHRTAARTRFGRLLRSPSLFEDMVKVICTCNVAWPQTVAMVDKIVLNWGVPAGGGGERGFPTPRRLAGVTLADLKRCARVGYRAEFLHQLAREVADGKLNLQAIEEFAGPTDELCRQLRRIHGVGDYAAGHLCMLLGRYDRLAVDTELVRFLHERYPRRQWTPRTIPAHYASWHPFDFLAYWFELWQDYVDRHGRADLWEANGVGRRITAARGRQSTDDRG